MDRSMGCPQRNIHAIHKWGYHSWFLAFPETLGFCYSILGVLVPSFVPPLYRSLGCFLKVPWFATIKAFFLCASLLQAWLQVMEPLLQCFEISYYTIYLFGAVGHPWGLPHPFAGYGNSVWEPYVLLLQGQHLPLLHRQGSCRVLSCPKWHAVRFPWLGQVEHL